MNSLDIIVKALDEKQAEDIVILDFENKSIIADYYVICNGNNDRQLDALVENVCDKLKENNIEITHIEDNENSGWRLIATNDTIVHVFSKNDRAFYSLEKLWMDIKRVDKNEIL